MTLLTCIGVTIIILHGSILKPIRGILGKVYFLKKLLSCSLCLGFWVGVGLALVQYKLGAKLYDAVCLPFASASACWLFDSLIDFLQLNSLGLKQNPDVKRAIRDL